MWYLERIADMLTVQMQHPNKWQVSTVMIEVLVYAAPAALLSKVWAKIPTIMQACDDLQTELRHWHA